MTNTDVESAVLTACAVCEAEDPLGIGLCPACVTSDAAGRALVFVRPERGDGLGDHGGVLDRVLDARDPAAARALLRAGRPLLGVPDGVEAYVVPVLESQGLATRSVTASNAWLALPSRFYLMLLCMVGVGLLAGIVTAPSFLWLSPVLALMLFFIGQRTAQRPLVAGSNAGGMPPALHAEITGTLLGLPPGTARDRLIDLVRIGRPLTADLLSKGDHARVRDSVHDLLRAACETAREADRLGRSADVIRSSLVWTPEVAGEEQAESARAVLLRCSELAGRGITGLTDAVTALGRIDAEAAGLDGPVGYELQKLTRGLEEAARVHGETYRELNELLG